MIDREELERLIAEAISRGGFVSTEKCECTVLDLRKALQAQDERFQKLETMIAVLNAKLSWLIGILSAIGVCVLGIAAKAILGG